MAVYLLKRLASLALALIAASLVVFALIEVVPGDPARTMLGINATDAAVAALRDSLGLNQNIALRYLDWVGGMLRGDFGQSYSYRVPVAQLIGDRLWVSVPLAGYALALTVVLALPVGLAAAALRGRAADYGLMGLTQLGIAVPNFWFAMLLVLIFAVKLPLFRSGGFAGWDAGLGAGLWSLTLPAVALALPQASILARVLRSALIETAGQDYIRTARAKGLTARGALLRHGLRNALIPVLTIMGLQFSFLLAGAVIIEKVFFLPGLGMLLFQAITQRDLIVVESTVMLLVAAVIMVNFLTDLAYAWVDPRLRRRGRA
ncbi:peptide ABC transporter [Pacificitalea manganoxidans]|uniref:Peptide ABC transporter n=1 Tax=Pacificitalea manganoxidans TaxID=1411902 RepID=A0A291LWD9_9RHOB|nr:ABC transporter permease [Pacificitalea manganoxidans]MAQ46198.1 ABC transporter permease [Actibacterium sp.]OWU70680.1 peptide ABC transporter [Roseovarius sp. 22II1-1F6A]ATI41066.1 peptide ABC transporter [Pacificitalea manganoxidans]MBF52680.1 ABC transporter permease [Actibacterium sp.]MDR6308433.1 peptide/nickel transport system permease protein [Pacificitalea manganoxidans]|tara:strand:+ start:28 stop:981 length:954 start_codon:yes stop_codon:yes gene_type:complete